jgi:putative addiction module killer protein
VIEVQQTEHYAEWYAGLRDCRAQARIASRLRRVALGNPGDIRPVGKGVSELRVDYGPGYRVYLTQRGSTFVILLAGGDNRSQQKDIRKAIELSNLLKKDAVHEA